jgi:FemAB-related protein (PEP-CTERM system-associated)
MMSALGVRPDLVPTSSKLDVRVHSSTDLPGQLPRLEAYFRRGGQAPLTRDPAWLLVMERGLRHPVYCLEAVEGEKVRGILPLAYVRSWMFGRFLVSLPYVNYGGPTADHDAAAAALIDRAVMLADELDVRYLELRNEWAYDHPALAHRNASKFHMRLALPASDKALWCQISGKVRNQVRKAQENQLTVGWGGEDVLSEFYSVFSCNMRDLGTPVFGRELFQSILRQFPDRSEICVVRSGATPVAAALLLHGWGVSEVPSASSLRQYNSTCANMLLYWSLLERAVERGQEVFDFGRSSQDSGTYRFKKQWGAVPCPSEWQYYLRKGTIQDMRPQNPRYQSLIRIWQRLPIRLTRFLGPTIVRAIP